MADQKHGSYAMVQARRTANQRLAILRQAEECGSVGAVCDEHGISRTIFYRWKSRYAEGGIDALTDRPPIAASHPRETKASVAKSIAKLALQKPHLSCRGIAQLLSTQGRPISAATVHKVLAAARLSTPQLKAQILDQAPRDDKTRWNANQLALLKRFNSNIIEQHLVTRYKGCVRLGYFSLDSPAGQVWVYAAIEVHSCYAHAQVSSSFDLDQFLDVLVDATQFYNARHIQIERMVAFPRLKVPTSALFLTASSNAGFIERFARALKSEKSRAFDFKGAASSRDMDAVRRSLATWLIDYNTRPLAGFPTYGRSPTEILPSLVNEARRQRKIAALENYDR